MSGPKSYHVAVFDKHLKALFQVQGEVKLLWEEMLKQAPEDDKTSHKEGLQEFLTANKASVEKALMDFNHQVHGVVNQKQFDEFYSKIHNRIEKLKKHKKLLADQLAKSMEQDESYRMYLKHEKLIQKLAADFQLLKKQSAEMVEQSRLSDKDKQTKIKLISETGFDVKIPPIQKEKIARLEGQILLQFHEAREQLGSILSGEGNIEPQDDHPDHTSDDQLKAKEVIKRIKVALLKVRDNSNKTGYEKRLKKLQLQKKKSATYFMKELFADVQNEIKQQELLERLTGIKVRFEKADFYPSIGDRVKEFSVQLEKALNRDHNRADEVQALENFLQELGELHQKARIAEAVDRDEKAYIRSRLVSSMKDLNYEVATKTEVIDFESGTDFLLSIPGQENFLNLRFDDQGKVLYNFLIPEDKKSLGLDEAAVKLSEMEETCNAFKQMLNDLRDQGLDIDLKNEIPISEKALIQLPDYHAEQLKKVISGSKTQNKIKKEKRKQKRL